MVRKYPSCSLWGNTFSPKAVEAKTGIVFDKENEPGDIAISGPYRNQPTPYGSAYISLQVDPSSCDPLSPESFQILARNIPVAMEAGATDIVIHCDVDYYGQCNLEMSPEFLAGIADLGVPFTISCWLDEDGWDDE